LFNIKYISFSNNRYRQLPIYSDSISLTRILHSFPFTADYKAESIMSVDKDMNVFFVGQAGRMIMKNKQENDSVDKIDFKKYMLDTDE